MEKSEIFCSHPEKCSPAKLESSWLALSEGLSTGVSLPLTLTASLHLCHLQTQTVGVWGFSRGVQFGFGELPGVWDSTVWATPCSRTQELSFELLPQSCHDNQPIFQSPDWVLLPNPGTENTSKISNFSPDAQWVSVQLFCQIKKSVESRLWWEL